MLWTVVSFLAFTFSVAAISYWYTRKDRMTTSDAYFLGGRSLTAWVIAGSLIMTNLSTEHLIGLNGDAFNHTIAVTAWETLAAPALVLTALYFLPRYLKSGFATIPEFLAQRYDQSTRVIATVLFLFSYVFARLPVVLLLGAIGLESLFDVSENLGMTAAQSTLVIVWTVGTLGSLYAIFGGLKAVAISDTVNGIGFLAAGLLVPFLALVAIGDGSAWASLAEVYAADRPKFDITGDEPGSFLPMGVLFSGLIVVQVFAWCTNQEKVQRALGAKSLAEGQKGVLLGALFKLLGPFVVVLPGVLAYHMFKDTLGPDDYVLAYPTLVKAVLPPALIGLFAAVMVGAILSTFNSVLNSSATLFSQGIYQALFNKEATGRQMVASGRVCSIVLAIVTMIMAPLIDASGSLYNYLQMVNSIFNGPLLAVILLGFLTRYVSAAAARIGLIAGPIAFYLLVFSFGDAVQGLLRNMFGLSHDVHFLHLLGLVFVLTIGLMVLISRFKPAENIYVPTHTGEVDITPWKYTKEASIVICGITAGFYILLAQ